MLRQQILKKNGAQLLWKQVKKQYLLAFGRKIYDDVLENFEICDESDFTKRFVHLCVVNFLNPCPEIEAEIYRLTNNNHGEYQFYETSITMVNFAIMSTYARCFNFNELSIPFKLKLRQEIINLYCEQKMIN